jgi:hypothetical protein
MINVSGGILLFAIVLCISLLSRIFISQFFSHKIHNEEPSKHFMGGLITNVHTQETNKYTRNIQNSTGINKEGG